jgi:hypothetical protein
LTELDLYKELAGFPTANLYIPSEGFWDFRQEHYESSPSGTNSMRQQTKALQGLVDSGIVELTIMVREENDEGLGIYFRFPSARELAKKVDN